MKDIINFIISIILLIVVAAAVVLSLAKCVRGQDEEGWNNGYCECGGHWKYEQAIGHQYSTSYIYHCDNCGKRIELRRYFEEVEENGK